jgi:hypothetical protein
MQTEFKCQCSTELHEARFLGTLDDTSQMTGKNGRKFDGQYFSLGARSFTISTYPLQ